MALAALRAAVFFAAMTVAYYGWAVVVPGFGYEPDLVEVAAVLVVALVLPEYRSTRLWALALALPMWWVASTLIQELLYGTGVIR